MTDTTMDDVYKSSGGSTFKAEDVEHEDLELVIMGWESKLFDQTDFESGEKYKAKKVILSFGGTEKQLICNKTNAGAIAAVYGKEFANWIGKPITLFEGRWGPDNKPCVRVRIPKPKKKMVQSENPAEGLDDEIPY